MMRRKRAAALLLALLLTFGVCAGAFADEAARGVTMGFSDVPLTAWYCAEVSYAYNMGLVNGVTSTQFLPSRSVKRGEFVTMLGRMLMPADFVPSGEGPEFADVPEGRYYAPYIRWAAECGLVNGITADSFRPEAYIRRQDMAVILYRAQQLDTVGLLPYVQSPKTFADQASISGYAVDAIAALQQQGLLGGDNNGNINPKKELTRAEAAAVISRFHAILTNHVHNYVKSGSAAATCTAAGYDRYDCACGSYYGKKTASALGHTWEKTGMDAANRRYVYVCKRCGIKGYIAFPAPEDVYTANSLLRYNEMVSTLSKLETIYPELIRISSAGKSVRGLDLPLVEFGRGSRYIFLNGNIHAREYITTNYLLEMLDEYAYAYVKNTRIGGYAVRSLLDAFTLVVLPCSNPDGRAMAIADDVQYKANANGVDLNRNFPIYWSSYSDDGYYGGPSAGSEPETQAIMKVLRDYPFELVLDCHTAGNAIYYTDTGCPADFSNRSRAIANALAAESGYVCYSATVGAGLANYVRNKGAGIPGLTIEMWPTLEHPINCSGFYTLIWDRLDTMPAIAMQYLQRGRQAEVSEEFEHIENGPEG